MKNPTQINAANQKYLKKIRVYHCVSLKSLIDNHFYSYGILWMLYFKIVVANIFLTVTKFEIVYANYLPLNYTEIYFRRFNQKLENTLLAAHPNKSCSVLKAKNMNLFW